MKFLEGRAHLVRVALLFLAGVVVFLVLRGLFVPDDFGVYGHYRAGALEDNRQPPAVHAGLAACAECHADTDAQRRQGRHARISCEACHGAQARHAAAPDQVKPGRPQGRTTCLRCHAANVARPATLPQIDPDEHAGDAACVSCHVAHQPGATPEAK